MGQDASRSMAETTQVPGDATEAALAGTGSDAAAVGLRIHDASRVEWTVAVPLPEPRPLGYEIEVELEVPAGAMASEAPWDQLQVFTRLDGPTSIVSSDDVTIDSLRRGAVTLTRMLARAKDGFARHCQSAGEHVGIELVGQSFLSVWLEAALRTVREARAKLTRSAPQESPQIARERELIDEYASVRLFDMLADADRVVRETPGNAEVQGALDAVRADIAKALRDEMAYRRSHSFLCAEAGALEELERYIARAASLKKHFEEVLFLERETEQLDERVQLWTRVGAALLAGMVAMVPVQLILSTRAFSRDLGWGLLVLAAISGGAYALREQIKERGRFWLSARMIRFHSQRLSRCRVPSTRLSTRDLVVDAREWCRQTTRSQPDPLNPEGGASLRVTQIEYLHRGVVRPHVVLYASGVRRILHIFRYDLSPLLHRLDDEPKPVPVLETGGEVAFQAAPRRYRIPISVGLMVGGEYHEQHAIVVLDRGGLRRLEPA